MSFEDLNENFTAPSEAELQQLRHEVVYLRAQNKRLRTQNKHITERTVHVVTMETEEGDIVNIVGVFESRAAALEVLQYEINQGRTEGELYWLTADEVTNLIEGDKSYPLPDGFFGTYKISAMRVRSGARPTTE